MNQQDSIHNAISNLPAPNVAMDTIYTPSPIPMCPPNAILPTLIWNHSEFPLPNLGICKSATEIAKG